MKPYFHKVFLVLSIVFLGGGLAGGTEQSEIFIVSGPPVMESLVFAVMASQHPDKISFIPWHSPDQARALIIGKKVNASIITISDAATFYSKGMPVRVAGVFATTLWVISNQNVSGQMPLKGTLLFPFGHREMPELVFNAVYKNDFPELTKIHTSGPLETVNRLLLGKADHALLAEPAATMAQAKSGVDGQPVLTKHLNLGKAWEEKFNGRPLYVSALSLFGDVRHRKKEIRALIASYNKTYAWIKLHPAEAIAIAKEKVPAIFTQLSGLKFNVVAAQLLHSQSDYDAAAFFLERMYEQSPSSIGGKRPSTGLFLRDR